MKCSCGDEIRVSHTYPGELRKQQRGVCQGCGKVYRLEVTAYPVRKRGDGARAVARKTMKVGEGDQEA